MPLLLLDWVEFGYPDCALVLPGALLDQKLMLELFARIVKLLDGSLVPGRAGVFMDDHRQIGFRIAHFVPWACVHDA